MSILGLLKKERVALVPQREQLANTPKKKQQSNLFRSSDHEEGESQGEREPHLGKRGGSEREHGVERVDSTEKESKFQARKGGQVRRASLGEVEGSTSG